jgi:hypothetical protein
LLFSEKYLNHFYQLFLFCTRFRGSKGMPINAAKTAKNKPFIGIDLCTLLSSQGTYALGRRLLTRFQGRPPNLVDSAQIDKSA